MAPPKAPLVVPGVLDSLGPIRQYVTDAATAAGLDAQGVYRLTLALDEIATNVIMYGYEGVVPPGDVRVAVDTADGRLRVTMEDTGRIFDPRGRALPTEEDLAKDLDDRPIGGLGIFLAINGVDELDYRVEDGVNKNIFLMNLSGN